MATLSPLVTGRRLRRLALLALAWCVMTGAVFGGCKGLFTPAIPEPPSGRPIVPDYRTPEATLNTMRQAIAAKALGSSAWLGAFRDSTRPEDTPAYHQVFDAVDLDFFEGGCQCAAPSDWRASHEQNFYATFLNVRPGDDYAALFEPWDENPDDVPGDDTAVLHRRYTVLATAPDGNSTLVIAVGYADLTFTRVSADRWLITRWVDHLDPDVGVNPTDPYQLSLGRQRLESTR